jgi:hypothetical protein
MQTVYQLLTFGRLKEEVGLSDLEMGAMLLGAACHDFNHPGVNNKFQIDAQNHLAMTYNDISVLEHMHVASTF